MHESFTNIYLRIVLINRMGLFISKTSVDPCLMSGEGSVGQKEVDLESTKDKRHKNKSKKQQDD